MNRSSRSNIRRLAVGRLISVTGGAAAFTALNFEIWSQTRSHWMQALALFLTFGVAGLLGPFAGGLGDRFDRRKVMIWSEAVAAVFFGAMALVHRPTVLIVLAFGSAVAELPFLSASRAAIPNLVDRDEDISWANSLVTLGVHAGIAVGPVLGGVLGALTSASWVFALNAVTFIVSLALTVSVRARFQESTGGVPREHQGVSAGLVYLWRERVLRRLMIAWSVFLLGMGVGMVADAPLATSFHWGSGGYGLMIAAWGLGSTLGAGAGRWMTSRTELRWMVGGASVISVSAFVVGFAPLFVVILAALLTMGVGDGFTIVAENGIMQRRTPDALRSRVMGAFDSVLACALAIAYIAAAPLLNVMDPQSVYRLGGATALGATLLLLPLLRRRTGEAVASAGPGPAPEPGLNEESVTPEIT